MTIILASLYLMKNYGKKNNAKVSVLANGKRFEYSLQNDGIFNVQGALGKTSFEINNNKIRIIDSPCPNKTCIANGWSNFVVCLPNKVFIQIENSINNDDEVQFDAISD